MFVIWQEVALDRLADIYVAASPGDRDEIEAATLRINASLASDPWHLGESRSVGRRVWFEHPLMVAYRIVVDSNTVIVSHVARLRSRK